MTDCLTDSDLHRYHAGELDEAEETRVREHLAQCETCAQRDAELVAKHEELLGRLKGMVLSDAKAAPPERAAPQMRIPEHDTVSLPRSGLAGTAEGDLAVPRELGSVRLIREIGRGGMGVVWLGHDQVLDRDVAVKFLLGAVADEGDPHFKQFLEGARAEASLRHPNIVSVQTAGVVSDLPYLVVDYIDGPSLRQVVKKVGPTSVATAVRLVSEVAAAVAVLHEQGIVHRDLKPANVLLDRNGQVLVTDFGLASLHRRDDQPLWAAGTPAYMAPEAFEGKASPQTDVYAMGMMLFELLGGSLAGVGGVTAMRARQANEPLPLGDLSENVPSQLREIIERATHTQAIFRYKTAEHFERAMGETVAADHPVREVETELKTLVARSIAEPTADTPTHPGETTPGSSYFDRLAELADSKRSAATGGVAPTQAEADTEIEQPEDRRIAVDLPCVSCGYNLRGLSPDGNCPECNTPVADSLHPDRLIFADRGWLSIILLGQTVIHAAIIIELASEVLRLAGRLGVEASISIGAIGAAMVALFASTSREPFRLESRWSLANRWLPRAALLVAVVTIPVMAVLYYCGVLDSLSDRGDRVVEGAASFLMATGVLVAAVGLLRYLATLAVRIPDPALARRSRTAAGAICCLLILTCVVSSAVPMGTVFVPFTYGGVGASMIDVPYYVFKLAACLVLLGVVGGYRRAFKAARAGAVQRDAVFGEASGRPAKEPDSGKRSSSIARSARPSGGAKSQGVE